jgi:DHA2 family multidrug resistance protein
MAFSDVFLILALLFAAVVLLVPLARKPLADAVGGVGGH